MSSIFSAKEPALGYYYQIIRGLVLLLVENGTKNPCLRRQRNTLQGVSLQMVVVVHTKLQEKMVGLTKWSGSHHHENHVDSGQKRMCL